MAPTAPAGSNGVYAYGNANLFPASSLGATNYWVDVMFSPASGGGSNQTPVAVNDTGFGVTQNSSISIAASTLLANDNRRGRRSPDGHGSNGSNGTASFNAQTNTVSFTPTAGYTGPASFSYAVADGRGGAGERVRLADRQHGICDRCEPVEFNPTPSITAVNDPNSVELGLKFQASGNGDVTGLRFYKGASNTGTHVANLWTSTGTLLATATFTNETATGWQQVNFATPVTITSGNNGYVASYHTPGNYAADPGLFNAAVSNGPLTHHRRLRVAVTACTLMDRAVFSVEQFQLHELWRRRSVPASPGLTRACWSFGSD